MHKRLKNRLLTGLSICIFSEISFTLFVSDFRISPAVILYPVLLMTVDASFSVVGTGMITSGLLFIFRSVLCLLRGYAFLPALRSVFPGSLFYLVYALLFHFFIGRRSSATLLKAGLVSAACDFLSNCAEIAVRVYLMGEAITGVDSIPKILAIALFRAIAVYLSLLCVRQYHSLLKKQEHERRYQRLFLLTAGLKSEMYLMEKNSRQIEAVMQEAYTLYEQLVEAGCAEKICRKGLEITGKVHDIKKDYFRVISGLREEIDKEPDTGSVRVEDLFKILTETVNTDIARRKMNVSVSAQPEFSFKTGKHYSLITVLLNLTTNAAESIPENRRGRVTLREYRAGDSVIFQVQDNGCGIDPQRLTVIFEMGYSTKFNEVTGNIYRGVGLCSVKQITEEILHGSISVVSDKEKGTCFTVSVPVKEIAEEEA